MPVTEPRPRGQSTIQEAFRLVGGLQGAFQPRIIDGLVLELWSHVGASLAGAKATDGDTVDQWADQSGRLNHATQATVGSRPTYQTGGLNGRPILRADGSDDALEFSDVIVSGSQARTLFVVAKSAAAIDCRLFQDGAGTPTNMFKLTSEYAVRINGGSRVWDREANPAAFEILAVTLSGPNVSDLALHVNGVTPAVLSTTDAVLNTTGSGVAFGSPWQGDVAAALLYNRALSRGERAAVESYLSTFYGITLES